MKDKKKQSVSSSEISNIVFSDLVDIDRLQKMMEYFYELTELGIGIIDDRGKILVAVGWQDICMNFHRVHPEMQKRCLESDEFIRLGMETHKTVEYKCQNGLHDIACPIIIKKRKIAAIYFGQFFYEDDRIDYSFFEEQARKYDLDVSAYLNALKKVPIIPRKKVESLISFYSTLAELLTDIGLSRLLLTSEYKASQKKIEEEIHKQKKLLDNIINNLPLGLQIFDKDGFSYRINNKQKELLGLPDLSEGIGEFNVLKDPYSIATGASELYKEVYEKGKTINNREFLYDLSIEENKWQTRKEKRYFNETIFPVYLYDKLSHVIALLQDVTEQKLTEQELQRIKVLLDDNEKISEVGAWEYSIENDEVNCTNGLYDIHQIPRLEPENIIDTILDLYSPEDKKLILEASSRCIATGEIYENEFNFTTPTGKSVWVRTVMRPVIEKGKIIKIIGSVKNITMLKEKELLLQDLLATKDRIFSIIAHDLRNPFASIIEFSRLIAAENDIANIKKYISFINKSATEGFNLLVNLLEWSRIQTGRITCRPKMISLQIILDRVLSYLEAPRIEKKISLETAIPEKMEVFADEIMLETIIRNLISNALKFTDSCGRIEVSAFTTGNEIYIRITDDGIGIPEDRIDNLLKINKEFTRRGTHNEKGTGLGLIIINEFVTAHNGSLLIESKEHEGTRFTVILPCRK